MSWKNNYTSGVLSRCPLDSGTAKGKAFQIIDGKIMPGFSALSGMGDKAAADLAEAATKGPFTSKDDIRQRGKVSKTILDDMKELGVLGDLPDTNQYDFFSLLQ